MKQIFFPSMSILPSIPNIYRALGYAQKKTQLADVLHKDMDRYIEEARAIITLKGACRREHISTITGAEIFLKNKIAFKSRALAKFLKGSTQVFLFGATAGPAIMEAIVKKTDEKDLTRAVVYDAVAGEMVDAALAWIGQYVGLQLRRSNLFLDPRRFSAGDGDFGVENQRVFWEQLDLKELGVSITETCFLVPEKSVTAISGIRANRRNS